MKTTYKKLAKGLQWMVFALCFVIGTVSLHAQSITSNLTEEDNSSAVTLFGSGFAANENISLQVKHIDNIPGTGISSWFVTTDGSGAFQTTRIIPTKPNEDIADFIISAQARISGTSAQIFLDGITPNSIKAGKAIVSNNAAKNDSPPPSPPPAEFIIDCSGVPDPGNTLVTTNPVCANIEFTLSLQNSGGTGVTYQWQSNTGGGFADIAGAIEPTLTTTQSVGTNYQCIVTCTNSGLFTVSSNLLVSNANPSGCPLTVISGGTAKQIAESLLGPGVTVSNATINCTSNAYGIFSGGLANLGLSSGIVLTSGSAIDLIGPNSSPAQTTDNLMPGDSDLTVLTTSETFDACYIAFDFVPTCDSIAFDYVFGSEEYPEFVNSPFNDVFAFFISGPGIIGTQNMALVPGALIPIEVNNVNDGYSDTCTSVLPGPCMNCQYYVNNCEGTTLQYDGYTTTLAATAKVQSGQTYHLKIAIADAGDPVLDSGVMLESNSLSCVSTAVVEADAYRGCQNGQVRFCKTGSTADAQTIHYTIGGTAINGVDYNTIADSIVIPAGQQCSILEIVATQIVTGITKTVELTILDGATLTVNISDGVQVNTSVTIDEQCGFSILTASGADTYTWSPAEGLTATTGETIIASPAVPTTYTVIGRITESGCVDTTTVNVSIGPPLYTYYIDADADGFGNLQVPLITCLTTPPTGYVTNSTDCNDANALVYPGAIEIINGIDDNCNGTIDEGVSECPLPTELTEGDITATSAELEWDAVVGVISYKVRYKVAKSSPWLKFNTPETSVEIEGLLANTKYTWQVRSNCSKNPEITSVWSEKQKFTTAEFKVADVQSTSFKVYPNPFTSSSTISFYMYQDSQVLIELFDVTGKKLQTILDENIAAGKHEVNLNRQSVAAGIYFLKLLTADEKATMKIVIE